MQDMVLLSAFLTLVLSPCILTMFRRDEDEC